MVSTARIAARENASWCATVCATHGLLGGADDRVWAVPRRSPPLYPDAVTLSPAATPADVLAGVDAGPGCSVKDSFAALDLAPHGFVVIVEGHWVAGRAPDGAVASGIRVVEDRAGLSAWLTGWAGDDPPGDVLRPGLLADPAVRFVADAEQSAGAVLHRDGDVLGVSNTWGDPAAAWRLAVRAAAALSPGVALVAWVTADEAGAARDCGLGPVGAMRVWLRPD